MFQFLAQVAITLWIFSSGDFKNDQTCDLGHPWEYMFSTSTPTSHCNSEWVVTPFRFKFWDHINRYVILNTLAIYSLWVISASRISPSLWTCSVLISLDCIIGGSSIHPSWVPKLPSIIPFTNSDLDSGCAACLLLPSHRALVSPLSPVIFKSAFKLLEATSGKTRIWNLREFTKKSKDILKLREIAWNLQNLTNSQDLNIPPFSF